MCAISRRSAPCATGARPTRPDGRSHHSRRLHFTAEHWCAAEAWLLDSHHFFSSAFDTSYGASLRAVGRGALRAGTPCPTRERRLVPLDLLELSTQVRQMGELLAERRVDEQRRLRLLDEMLAEYCDRWEELAELAETVQERVAVPTAPRD